MTHTTTAAAAAAAATTATATATAATPTTTTTTTTTTTNITTTVLVCCRCAVYVNRATRPPQYVSRKTVKMTASTVEGTTCWKKKEISRAMRIVLTARTGTLALKSAWNATPSTYTASNVITRRTDLSVRSVNKGTLWAWSTARRAPWRRRRARATRVCVLSTRACCQWLAAASPSFSSSCVCGWCVGAAPASPLVPRPPEETSALWQR